MKNTLFIAKEFALILALLPIMLLFKWLIWTGRWQPWGNTQANGKGGDHE